MKILHINTFDKGGAANAAIRLHHALLKQGIDSSFLSIQKTNFNISHHHSIDVKPKIDLQPALSFKNYFREKRTKQIAQWKVKEKQRALSFYDGYMSFDFFSFAESLFDLTQSKYYLEADILHLHWISDFIDYPSFFPKVRKPIVWTLHDMNPFSGSFHYQLDMEKNSEKYDKLDKKTYEIKQKSIAQNKNITIVTPSRWLLEDSSNSEILGQYPHYYIPNSLDTEIYRHYNQNFAREVFRLPLNKKILLFVSQNTNNFRKGFDLLLSAIENLTTSSDYLLCAVGGMVGKRLENQNNNIHYLGYIADERLLALAYNTADAFILPSKEDNLPNTMLESLCCGTPVIGLSVGGLVDIIKTGENGILVEDSSSEALKAAITTFLNGKYSFNRTEIEQKSRELFAPDKQAKAYMKIYDSLLNK